MIPPRFLSDVSDPDPLSLTSAYYPIHVRLPSTGHTLPVFFLDEFGSSSPTIHPVDLQALGAQPNDPSLGLHAVYHTANEPVLQKTVWLQATFADLLDVQFRAVTPYKLFEFPDFSGGTNLGGPLLRSLVIQGSLPDTQPRLAVDLTRSGLA